MQFEAQTDAATPVNLTYHPYFNFAGDMRLRMPASQFLPVEGLTADSDGKRARR